MGKKLSFEEWSLERNRKREAPTVSASPTTGNSAPKMSFEEWSAQRNKQPTNTNNVGLKKWTSNIDAFTKSVRNYYANWNGMTPDTDRDIRKIAQNYLALANDYRAEYAGDEKSLKAISAYEKGLNDLLKYAEPKHKDAEGISSAYGISDTELEKKLADKDNPIAFTTSEGEKISWRGVKEQKDLSRLYGLSSEDLEKEQAKSDSGVAYTTMDGQNITWNALLRSKKKEEQYADLSSRDDWDKLSKYKSTIPSADADYNDPSLQAIDWAYELVNNPEYSSDRSDTFRAKYMTDEEREVFNYLYHTEGKDAALEWQYDLMHDLEELRSADIAKKANEYASQGFWQGAASWIGARAAAPLAAFEYVGDLVDSAFTGRSVRNDIATRNAAVDKAITDNVDMKIGNFDVFDFGYGTATSMVDSALSSVLGSIAGPAVLGLSAAASATNAALDRGMDQKEAVKTGVLAGFWEGVFERVSIGNFKKLQAVDPKRAKDYVFNVIKSMGINASEEGLTEIANAASDIYFNGDFSDYETSIRMNIQSGMTEEEARKEANKNLALQIAESAASGALMGIGFGAGGSAIGHAKAARQAKKLYGSDAGALVQKALEIDPENAYAKQMQEKLKDSKNNKLSGSNLAFLAKQNEAALVESDKAKIQQAAKARLAELGATEDVDAVADALMKQAIGEKLTRRERDLIELNRYAPQVAEELDPAFQNLDRAQYDAEWAESHDNRWVQQIGTERINAEFYNRLTEPAQIAPETKEVENNTVLDPNENIAEISDEAAESPVSIENNGEFLNEGTKNATHKENLQVAEEFSDTEEDVVSEATENKADLVTEDTGAIADSVKSVSGDDLLFTTAEGAEIQMKEIGFASAGQEKAIRSIGHVANDAAEANALISAFRESKLSGEIFAKGIGLAYNQGRANIPFSNKSLSPSTRALPKAVRDMAFAAGQRSVGIEIEQQEAVHTANRAAAGSVEPTPGKVRFVGSDLSKAEKNTTGEGGVKYSTRSIESSFSLQKVNDYVHVQKQVVDTLSKEGFFDNGKNRIIVSGTGMVVEITKDGIRETLGSGMRYQKLPRNLKTLKLATIRNLPSLIRNSQLVEDDVKNRHSNNSSVKYAYLETSAEIDGVEYPVSITVRKSPQKNKFWIHEVRVNEKEQSLSSGSDIKPKQELVEFSVHDESVSRDKNRVNPKLSLRVGENVNEVETFFDEHGRELTEMQRASLSMLEKLSAMLGVDFYVYESYLNENGERVYIDEDGKESKAPNGKYYDGTGKIFIDLNAGNTGRGTMLYTASHELTHFIKDWSPKKFKILADTVVEYVEAKTEKSVFALIENKQADALAEGRELTVEEAYEEVIADAMESMLIDGKIIETMTEIRKKDASLWEKIRDWFKSLTDDIKRVLDTYKGVKPDSAEGKIIADMQEGYEQLQRVFADALIEGSENLAAARETKNTTSKGGVRYCVRNGSLTTETTEDERYEILKNAQITLSEVDMAAIRDVDLEDYNTRKKSAVLPGFKAIANQLGILNVDLENSEISFPFKFSGKNLEKSLHHQLEYGGTYQDYVKAMSCFTDIVKNAIPIEVHPEKKVGTARENPDLLRTYVLVSAFKDGKTVVPVQLEVKEFRQRGKSLYMTVMLTKIDLEVMDTGVPGETGNVPHLFSRSTISLRQLFENVNVKDGRFLKYVPDGFLNEKQKEAKQVAFQKQKEEYAGYGVKKNSSRSANTDRVNRTLERENARLREDVKDLKDLLRLQNKQTHGQMLKPSTVEKMAGILMKNYGAKGDKAELTARLRDAYSFIAKSDDVTWEEISEKAMPAAEWLRDNMAPRQDPYAQEAFSELHGLRIRLSDEQKREVAYQYGSYNTFRKLAAGNGVFTSSADASSLEDVWRELSEKYPSLFPEDTRVPDMPGVYLEAIETLNGFNRLVATQERDMLDMQDLVSAVYDGYWRVSTLYTVADKKQAEIEQLRSKHRDRMDALKESHAKTVDMLQQQKKTAMQNLRDRRARTEMRGKLRKKIRTLDSLLSSGDKQRNVKEDLRDLASTTLMTVDTFLMTDEEARVMKLEYESEIEALKAERDQYEEGSKEYKKVQSKIRYRNARVRALQEREDRRVEGIPADEVTSRLSDAYKSIASSDYAYIQDAYDTDVQQHLDTLRFKLSDTMIDEMSVDQIKELNDAVTMILTTIRQANRLFADNIKATREELSEAAISEIDATGKKRGDRKAASIAINSYTWNNEKPVYAFERIGSKTMTQLYENLFKGQGIAAKDFAEAQEYAAAARKKFGYQSWDLEKRTSFETGTGRSFDLSLGEMLSIYAYSKRDTAHKHLTAGGIVFRSGTKVVKDGKLGKQTYIRESAETYQLSDNLLGEIIAKLSNEQKTYVDAMQRYLSVTMGAKGNEVSMKLYGVKLYGEDNYFPMHVAPQYKPGAQQSADQKAVGQASLKNAGFTHSTVPNASDPIIIEDFMDVWSDHVVEMSNYHGMVLPLEDFRRVWEYRSKNQVGSDSYSVKAAMQNAFGLAGENYIDALYKDMNGGIITDPRESIGKKLVGQMKKASVFASASVLIQQPSAIGRAFAEINPKYFVGGKVSKAKHNAAWKELKKYAPVAIIKEIGYFDTDAGRSAAEYLKKFEYSGLGQKAKAVFTDADYRDELLAKGPALADEVTWVSIWEAVKRETKALHKDMDVHSDEFLQIAGDRFSKIIDRTQVYDSVLSRSSFMRSKNVFMNMVTSFMAEPTTTANMVESAFRSLQKGDKGKAAGIMASVMTSMLLNSALVSIVRAARDDDEDETFLEKYAASFLSEVVDGINPMTYLPWLRDIWSAFQGYDVERADMSIFSNVISGATSLVTALSKDEPDLEKIQELSFGIVGDIANIFGLPVKNIVRDTRATVNAIRTVRTERGTTWNSLLDTAEGSLVESVPVFGILNDKSRGDRLYEAIIEGDEVYAERLKSAYKDESAVNSAIRKALGNNEPRILEAAELRVSGKFADARELVEEIVDEGNFTENDIEAAIKSEVNELQPEEETDSEEKEKTIFDAKAYIDAILNGSREDIETVHDDLVATKIANGQTEKSAEEGLISSAKSELKKRYTSGEITKQKTMDVLGKHFDMKSKDVTSLVNQWSMKVVLGIEYDDIKDKFIAGEITESKAIEWRVRYGGQDQKDAAATVSKWKFEKENDIAYDELQYEFIEGNVTESEAIRALVNFGGKKQKEAEATVTEWKAEKETGTAYGNIRESFLEGNLSESKATDMYMEYGGKTQDEAEDAVAALVFEKENGFKYSDHKQKYLDGEISESTLREALSTMGEKDDTEVDDIVRAYDWLKENPKYDLTESQAVAYTKSIENYGISAKDAGIDPDTFVDYKKRIGKCEGTDLNGDGKTDKDSVRNAKLTVIHSLPLTPQQKDALYFQSKLAKSRIYQAPWH